MCVYGEVGRYTKRVFAGWHTGILCGGYGENIVVRNARPLGGVLGHAPPENFWILGVVRLILVQSDICALSSNSKHMASHVTLCKLVVQPLINTYNKDVLLGVV